MSNSTKFSQFLTRANSTKFYWFSIRTASTILGPDRIPHILNLCQLNRIRPISIKTNSTKFRSWPSYLNSTDLRLGPIRSNSINFWLRLNQPSFDYGHSNGICSIFNQVQLNWISDKTNLTDFCLWPSWLNSVYFKLGLTRLSFDFSRSDQISSPT